MSEMEKLNKEMEELKENLELKIEEAKCEEFKNKKLIVYGSGHGSYFLPYDCKMMKVICDSDKKKAYAIGILFGVNYIHPNVSVSLDELYPIMDIDEFYSKYKLGSGSENKPEQFISKSNLYSYMGLEYTDSDKDSPATVDDMRDIDETVDNDEIDYLTKGDLYSFAGLEYTEEDSNEHATKEDMKDINNLKVEMVIQDFNTKNRNNRYYCVPEIDNRVIGNPGASDNISKNIDWLLSFSGISKDESDTLMRLKQIKSRDLSPKISCPYFRSNIDCIKSGYEDADISPKNEKSGETTKRDNVYYALRGKAISNDEQIKQCKERRERDLFKNDLDITELDFKMLYPDKIKINDNGNSPLFINIIKKLSYQDNVEYGHKHIYTIPDCEISDDEYKKFDEEGIVYIKVNGIVLLIPLKSVSDKVKLIIEMNYMKIPLMPAIPMPNLSMDDVDHLFDLGFHLQLFNRCYYITKSPFYSDRVNDILTNKFNELMTTKKLYVNSGLSSNEIEQLYASGFDIRGVMYGNLTGGYIYLLE